MSFRATHLRWLAIAAVAVVTVFATASGAAGGRAEAKQAAAYLSGVLSPSPTPAESGRAEAKQAAAYLSGVLSLSPTPAESGRAEAKAFAGWMSLVATQPPISVTGPGGFDWADAGIGAVVMLGTILLLFVIGVGVASSRQSHKRQVPNV